MTNIIHTKNKNYARDTESKALLNINTKERDRIQMAREKARQAAQLEQRVSLLESQIKELQEMLRNGAKV